MLICRKREAQYSDRLLDPHVRGHTALRGAEALPRNFILVQALMSRKKTDLIQDSLSLSVNTLIKSVITTLFYAVATSTSEATPRLRQLQVEKNTLCSFLDFDNEYDLPNPVVQQGSTHVQARVTLGSPHAHDGELMNNYANFICFTITDDASLFPIWQGTVPQIARSYPFLRHGLLAFSAMHLRLTSTPENNRLLAELAQQHQGEALKSYIPHLQMITEESCPALFAFSTILSALSYSFLQSLESDLQGHDYITRFLEICNFLYGATVIATESKEWIRQSVLSPLVTLRSLDNVSTHLDSDPRVALEILLEYIELQETFPKSENPSQNSPQSTADSIQQTSKASLYETRISMLSNVFPTADGKPPQLGAVIGWPIFIGKGFLELLRERDNKALIVLAYYGASLHSFNSFWWLKGLGARLVRAISQTLDSDASLILQWPLQKVSSTS